MIWKNITQQTKSLSIVQKYEFRNDFYSISPDFSKNADTRGQVCGMVEKVNDL